MLDQEYLLLLFDNWCRHQGRERLAKDPDQFLQASWAHRLRELSDLGCGVGEGSWTDLVGYPADELANPAAVFLCEMGF